MTQHSKLARRHDTTNDSVGIDKRFSRTGVSSKKQLGTVRIGTVPEVCRHQRL